MTIFSKIVLVIAAVVCLWNDSLAQNINRQPIRRPVKASKTIVFPPPVLENPDLTDFCSLPVHSGSFIYTSALYCKIALYKGKLKYGEFWGLRSPNNGCSSLTAGLYLSDELALSSKIRQQLMESRKHGKPVLIYVVGVFERDNTSDEHGYEGMASFKWRLIAKHIVDIQPAP